MAATIVQSKAVAVNVGDASVDAAFDSPTTAGNHVVLMVGSDDYDTGNPTGFTLSNECAQETFLGAYLWWKATSGGETTFTYNIGSASPSCWILLEISGLEASPYDGSEGQFTQASSESQTTPNLTPTAGDRYLLAFMGYSRSGAFTAPPNGIGSWLNSFTEITEICTVLASGTRDQIGVASRAVTADGSTAYSSGATSDGAGVSTSRTGIIIAFKVAAEGETVTGTATGAFTFAAASSGKRTVYGSASRATTFAGAASGLRTAYGTATRATTFAGAASGQKTVYGTATRATTFDAPAAGEGQAETVTGTATGAFTFTGSSTGLRTVYGTATRSTTFAASSTGLRTVFGSSARATTFEAPAAGQKTVYGAATRAILFAAEVLVEVAPVKATSTSAVSAGRTSTPAVSARATSTAAVSAGRTSSAEVG